MNLNPDPLTVTEDPEYAIVENALRIVEAHRRPPRLAVDAGWLLVVAIVAAIAGVIVGRVIG